MQLCDPGKKQKGRFVNTLNPLLFLTKSPYNLKSLCFRWLNDRPIGDRIIKNGYLKKQGE
jgi:hypothetical protein